MELLVIWVIGMPISFFVYAYLCGIHNQKFDEHVIAAVLLWPAFLLGYFGTIGVNYVIIPALIKLGNSIAEIGAFHRDGFLSGWIEKTPELSPSERDKPTE